MNFSELTAIDFRDEEATWRLVERLIARDINRQSSLKIDGHVV